MVEIVVVLVGEVGVVVDEAIVVAVVMASPRRSGASWSGRAGGSTNNQKPLQPLVHKQQQQSVKTLVEAVIACP